MDLWLIRDGPVRNAFDEGRYITTYFGPQMELAQLLNAISQKQQETVTYPIKNAPVNKKYNGQEIGMFSI